METLLFTKLKEKFQRRRCSFLRSRCKKTRWNYKKSYKYTHHQHFSKKVLGSWVWQHSAFKEEDHARLDITHHSALTDEDVTKIEDAAQFHY